MAQTRLGNIRKCKFSPLMKMNFSLEWEYYSPFCHHQSEDTCIIFITRPPWGLSDYREASKQPETNEFSWSFSFPWADFSEVAVFISNSLSDTGKAQLEQNSQITPKQSEPFGFRFLLPFHLCVCQSCSPLQKMMAFIFISIPLCWDMGWCQRKGLGRRYSG